MKMEESAYVPNSIPPALVVFSQAGYGEPIRMQRPFSSHSQISDGKESLSIANLSPSSFGLRPMDSFGGLSAQLVHLQNPFLHPALEGRLPFGSSGAFRPIATSTSHSTPVSSNSGTSINLSGDHGSHGHGGVKNLPSAFTAPGQPSRRQKMESINEGAMDCRNREQHQDKNSPSYLNGGQRHRSASPVVNASPHGKEDSESMGDDREENLSPNSDMTDRSTPEDTHHSKRRRKGGQSQDTVSCPVCKMSLRPIELESHLLSEVEQLMCMSRLRRQQSRDEPSTSSSVDSPSASNKKEMSGTEVSQDSRLDTYYRIRANRHSRLRVKTRRRREESGGSHATCPVCQVPLQGSNEQFSAHVEACVRKNGDMLDEDEPVDIEGDGDGHEMEEYSWIGHRRSRATPSSYCPTAINMSTNSRRRDEENDSLEVVVDGDDTSTYGQPQYSESDIQSSLALQPHGETNNGQQDIKMRSWQDEEMTDESTGHGGEGVNHTIVIQALKGRVRELETKIKCGIPNDGNHCLICMDKYKKPVVSVSCWHVHCEDCWLRTLGTKKLCPQCNMITSPPDLRRIFL